MAKGTDPSGLVRDMLRAIDEENWDTLETLFTEDTSYTFAI